MGNTTETDKIFADFMGWKPCNCDYTVPHYKTGPMSWEIVDIDKCKFSTDWNLLMKVVDKIETMEKDKFIVTIESLYCVVSENGENPICDQQGYDTKIENVYHCLVKFLAELKDYKADDK